VHDLFICVTLPIDWFWLPIFPTNLVRGLRKKEMKFHDKGAVPVQISPSLFSQPWNDNQSIRICDTTHSYLGHDWFIRVIQFAHVCDMTHSFGWYDPFICGTWLIHTWDMTHSYVGHDSFICGTWLIHMWDKTHSHLVHDPYVEYDSFMCVTWPTHETPWIRKHQYPYNHYG
jgi:hypothetical protein